MILEKRYKYENKNTGKIEKIGRKCSIANLKRTKMPQSMIDSYIKYSQLPKGHEYFNYIMNAINGWLETHEPDKEILFMRKDSTYYTKVSNGLTILGFEKSTAKNAYRVYPVSFSYGEGIKHEHITRNYVYDKYFIIKAENEKELYKKLYELCEYFTYNKGHLLDFLQYRGLGYTKLNLKEGSTNEKI